MGRKLNANADVAVFAETSDRRFHKRYPITLELHYKPLKTGRVEPMGTGRTLNISSAGVLLETDTILPATGPIELGITWPILLNGICKLKLVMRGRIVRSDSPKVIAVKVESHEFHTAGRTMTAGSG